LTKWTKVEDDYVNVTTLTLGSQPRQRHWKVQAKNATRESRSHSQECECEGMNPHIPSGSPLWELESLWSPEFSKSDFKGSQFIGLKVLYTIGKFLKHWYLKWACMTHLNTYDISCGQKKGSKWKCQFDSWSLKVNNRLELCVCRWCVTYHWKYLEKGYNFSLEFTSIIGLHKKLWASKLLRVPISKISRLLTWESREKWHLGVTPMANHREYYKGGRWWLPPSLGRGESCELVYACGSSVHQKCSNYALTNLLFNLRMFIWNIDFFVTRPNPHFGILTNPFHPQVLRTRECTPNPYFIIFIFELAFESFKEFRSALVRLYIINEVWFKKKNRQEFE